MTSALIVIGVLALLIAGILLLRATVTIKYLDEFALTVRVLFLKFRILPAKERKIDPDDYSPRKFRRIIRKKEKKAEKRRRKAEKKAAKKAKKKAKAEEKAKRSGKVLVKKKRSLSDIVEIVELVGELLTVFVKRFAKHLRIKVARLHITVASDDAAKTACMYGAVSQGVAYILELLDRVTNLKYKSDSDVYVAVDFSAQKPSADIEISFSMSVGQLLDILLRTGGRFISLSVKKKIK